MAGGLKLGKPPSRPYSGTELLFGDFCLFLVVTERMLKKKGKGKGERAEPWIDDVKPLNRSIGGGITL